MKKIYAMIAVALMSVNLFAADPTLNDLQSLAKEGHYVACFSVPADGTTCNDIVWIGTYCSWSAENLKDLIVCQPLAGFDGWYTAVVPVSYNDKQEIDNQGKPVQLSECNKFSWDYQLGKYGEVELVAGTVNVESGQDGKETDLKGWSAEEPGIVRIKSWKNSPCGKVCNEHAYTIRLFDPYCEAHPEFAPSIRGSYDNWAGVDAMQLKDEEIAGEEVSVWVFTTPLTGDNLQFKFNNNAADKEDWSNQFEYYTPGEEGAEGKWSSFNDNFTLADKNPVYTKIDEYTLEFDFSDDTKYRYAKCGAIEYDTKDTFDVVITFKAPIGTPEAGVEVMGNYGGDATWATGTLMTADPTAENVWVATIRCPAASQIKFREAGDANWNQPYNLVADKDMDNLTVGAEWNEADHTVLVDYHDADKWCWKNNMPKAIENVVLTEKARKVIVDGVLYIVRDNKLFNVQGTQVR